MRKLMLSTADLEVVSFVVPAPAETRGTVYANDTWATNEAEWTCGDGCLEVRPEGADGQTPSPGGGSDEGDGDDGGSDDEDAAAS